MIVIPGVIIILEPLLALAGMYLAVFKTAYEPKRVQPARTTQESLKGKFSLVKMTYILFIGIRTLLVKMTWRAKHLALTRSDPI